MLQAEARERARRAVRRLAPAHDPFLSYAEFAALLGCCVATVRRLIQANNLPVTRLSARRVGVRQSVVEQYLADNEKVVA
jgi:excisionase family DNA binding protein